MADIIHRVGIEAPVAEVYRAAASIEGVKGWWTREVTGDSRVGGRIAVVFRDGDAEKGRMELEVITLHPDREVVWRVMDGPPEWIGTDITFRLAREGDYTILRFGHYNWREAGEFMSHCSMKWATFMLSLRQFVEAGEGRPSPDDLKIDNWN